MAVVATASVALPSVAHAQAYEHDAPGDVSAYPIEIEPHFAFAAENVYGATGYGAGYACRSRCSSVLSVEFRTIWR